MEIEEWKMSLQISTFLEPWPIHFEKKLTTFAGLLLSGLFLYFLKMWIWDNEVSVQIEDKHTIPPIYPSAIPYLGHRLSMAWDTPGFLNAVMRSKPFKNIPVRLRLFVTDVYLISGNKNIDLVRRNDCQMHTKGYKILSVQKMFGMPEATLSLFISDDSGIGSVPIPTSSSIPPHQRIDYLTHLSLVKLFTGPGLKELGDRFTQNLTEQLLTKSSIGFEWKCVPDLLSIMQEELLQAALKSMCGNYLLSLNPNFIDDFWAFNDGVHMLAKGYPRLFFPAAYKAREKCLESIKIWHRFIRGHFDQPDRDPAGWNPYFGSEYIKFRLKMWSKMDQINDDSAAAEDLGLIWATNGNSIPASYWMIAEVLRDSSLLSRVQVIVEGCRLDTPAGTLQFDLVKLCNDPLLQSIYAETLRLRVATFLVRSPAHGEFKIENFRIPKNGLMVIAGFAAQQDKDVWEVNDGHPVQEFWSERFLEYSNDASHTAKDGNEKILITEPKSRPSRFSLEGKSRIFMPYGYGQRMCPGRHFNKQEMMVNLAIMLTLFDIELLDPNLNIPDSDLNGYGFGVLWPKGKTPIRIRRRAI